MDSLKNGGRARKVLEWDNKNLDISLTLPSRYFFDPKIFEKEIDTIFYPSWHFVCHESELSKLYDYRVYDYTGKSIFSIRGEDGIVRSFFNVCSHRGAKLFSMPSGNAKRIKCFYNNITI